MTTTTTFKHKKIDKSVIHNGLNGFNGWVGGSRTASLCRAFPRSSIACSPRRWRALDIHHCPSRGSIWRCFRHLTPMMAMAWSGWCRVQMSLHSLSAVDNYRKALNLKNTTNRAGKENGDGGREECRETMVHRVNDIIVLLAVFFTSRARTSERNRIVQNPYILRRWCTVAKLWSQQTYPMALKSTVLMSLSSNDHSNSYQHRRRHRHRQPRKMHRRSAESFPMDIQMSLWVSRQIEV